MQFFQFLLLAYTSGNISLCWFYLNIWTPSLNNTSNLDVIVWIPGGGFITGGSQDSVYNASKMVLNGGNNFIFVTFNYRLGPFGFFVSDQLRLESHMGNGGLNGIYDQITALRWVKNNILSYGGNPQSITVTKK